jgi:hypothetical protein
MSRRKERRQEEIRTLMPATDDHGTLRRLAVRANLVWLAGHQRDVAAREAGTGKALTGMPVHRSTAPTLPGALNGPDLSGDIARKLTGLLRELLDRDWTPNAEADTEVKRWLQGARRWDQELWTDHEVLDWYDDSTDLRRRAERVLGPDAHGRWLGPCPVPDCVGEVRMGDDQAAAVCAVCGGFVTREQQIEWLAEEFQQRLMTSSEIASALELTRAPVPYSTLRRWITIGRLPEVETGLYPFKVAFDMATRKGRKTAA